MSQLTDEQAMSRYCDLIEERLAAAEKRVAELERAIMWTERWMRHMGYVHRADALSALLPVQDTSSQSRQ